ncbi:DUF1850 domain-containing protein [Geomicrobium sediminis]|uniref:DUF1850 domain-containing protein n=1 Tax=Geomicrobium sediminis TaxID=1347788 RepID=A0ABS2PAX0_9BACL|nr:DUF1850 domain-containing protein [Geomicrobium sediminis]MBM7632462.1 hypothetical protein [Geomicrobium sediminis]
MKPFLLLLCCILLAGSAQTTLFIEIRHAITKETFTIQQLSEDDELKLSWIHSVEKTPWEEYFTINKRGKLTLNKTRFQSFGAGVSPYGRGTTSIEDGYIVLSELNESFDSYRWFHSHDASFTWYVNENLWIHTQQLPHHESIELLVHHRL